MLLLHHMYRLTLLLVSFLVVSCGASRVASSAHRSSSSQASVVEIASKQKGKRYKYGGSSPATGFDCSGLILYSYAQAGVQLPRRSQDMASRGKKITLKDCKPGDLLFFSTGGRINHVAMVIKSQGGTLIAVHSTSSKGVIIEPIMESPYWKKRFKMARRVT